LLPKEGACGNERELVMECATFAKHWIYEVSRAGSSFLAWIPSLPKEVHHDININRRRSYARSSFQRKFFFERSTSM